MRFSYLSVIPKKLLNTGTTISDMITAELWVSMFNPFPNTPFQDFPNSRRLQMTTEMWRSKDFKIQIA